MQSYLTSKTIISSALRQNLWILPLTMTHGSQLNLKKGGTFRVNARKDHFLRDTV